MPRREPLRTRFHRVLHVLSMCVLGALLAAPLLLGPATSWTLTALGGAMEHQCACGMKPGTCGCPECAVLEASRQLAHRPSDAPAFRPDCGNEDVARGHEVLPPVVPPAAALALLLAPSSVSIVEPVPSPLDRTRDRPETPPPRRAGA